MHAATTRSVNLRADAPTTIFDEADVVRADPLPAANRSSCLTDASGSSLGRSSVGQSSPACATEASAATTTRIITGTRI